MQSSSLPSPDSHVAVGGPRTGRAQSQSHRVSEMQDVDEGGTTHLWVLPNRPGLLENQHRRVMDLHVPVIELDLMRNVSLTQFCIAWQLQPIIFSCGLNPQDPDIVIQFLRAKRRAGTGSFPTNISNTFALNTREAPEMWHSQTYKLWLFI